MDQNLHIILAQHKALQDVAQHFNRINWILHSIFIPIHFTLLAWLASKIKEIEGMEFIVICTCVVGLLLVEAWKQIFRRHANMIHALYSRLFQVEKNVDELNSNKITFDVHRFLSVMDQPGTIHPVNQKKTVKTHKVLNITQIVLQSLYIIIAVFVIFINYDPF